jgi:hypothetical protein
MSSPPRGGRLRFSPATIGREAVMHTKECGRTESSGSADKNELVKLGSRQDRHEHAGNGAARVRRAHGCPPSCGRDTENDSALALLAIHSTHDGRIQRKLCRHHRRSATRSRQTRVKEKTVPQEAHTHAFRTTVFYRETHTSHYLDRSIYGPLLGWPAATVVS